jgi:hypothetical protein
VPDLPTLPDELMAELLFVDPQGPAPELHLAAPSEPDPERTIGKFDFVTTPVRNGRRIAGQCSLAEEGFAFVRRETRAADFYDADHIRAVYYPEIKALAKSLTGASSVFVFDHTVRGTATGPRGSVAVEAPTEMIHCDFTSQAALETLRYLAASGEIDVEQRQVMQLNLWRPIRGPLRTRPLAVCDARSIRPESCLRTPVVRPDYTSDFYTLAYDPGQRWYYLPDMRTDEVIVLKNYDSNPANSRFAAHGALVDPSPPPDALPRESIEVRVFAVL